MKGNAKVKRESVDEKKIKIKKISTGNEVSFPQELRKKKRKKNSTEGPCIKARQFSMTGLGEEKKNNSEIPKGGSIRLKKNSK